MGRLTPIDAAWLAAMVDGEGSVLMCGNAPHVAVYNTDADMLSEITRLWGQLGITPTRHTSVKRYNGTPRNLPLVTLAPCNYAEMRVVLAEIHPHMRSAKRARAGGIIQYLDWRIPKINKGPNAQRAYTAEERALAEHIRALPSTSKTALPFDSGWGDLTPVNFSWLAGILDAEGSVCLTATSGSPREFHPQVTAGNTDSGIVVGTTRLFDQLGCRYHLKLHGPSGHGKRDFWSLMVRQFDAAETLFRAVVPYMRSWKKIRAELIVRWLESRSHQRTIGEMAYTPDELALAETIRTFAPPGVRARALEGGRIRGTVSMATLAHLTTAAQGTARVGVNPGELGEHPMPGPQGCGRTIPNQASTSQDVEGVRNEQVPGGKPKVCSDPYGNVGSAAEMTAPQGNPAVST